MGRPFSQSLLLLVGAITVSIAIGVAAGFSRAVICPTTDLIMPCTCTSGGRVSCSGQGITQSAINRAVTAMRTANGVQNPGQWLDIMEFSIFGTDMPKLDLSPLFYTRLSWSLTIRANSKLVSIYDSTSSSINEGKIESPEIQIFQNYLLANAALENFFVHFTNATTDINLSNNQVTGGFFPINDGSGDIEYLPGMSRFSQLRNLQLGPRDGSAVLGGGQLKRNRELRSLRLFTLFRKISLGSNAFVLEKPSVDFGNSEFLQIYLNGELNDASFDSTDEAGNPVLWGTNRPTKIDLGSNRFVFFSQKNFQTFLDEDQRNIILAEGNEFVCDDRMKWLKDGRDSYEWRVIGVICTNDPGETVFTTSLIS